MIKRVQNKYCYNLISIRTDHGTEFDNQSFADFCRAKGIGHNFSAPHTPQQNGVVERMNRTLEGMARTMLLCSGLPKSFWAEAVNTACYTHNRAMIRSILNKTPYELLRGRKPNISHLRCFGAKCYVHNNGKNWLSKFDPLSDEAVFIGYSNHSKAYRVYNKRTLCVEESIHVIFDENDLLTYQEDDEDEDENDPDFWLTRNNPPELEEEDREIIGSEVENINQEESNKDEELEQGNKESEKDSSKTEVTKSTVTLSSDSGGTAEVTIDKVTSTSNPGGTSKVTMDNVTSEANPNNIPSNVKKWKHAASHPTDAILSDFNKGIQTRRSHKNNLCVLNSFLSQIEPTKVEVALTDPDWIAAMQDELGQFERNEVWHIVPKPSNRTIIGTR